VELTLVIQSSVSVWTDKSISAVSAAGSRTDGCDVYLRGQTVDAGSYGGYVNAHACTHKGERVMEGWPRTQTDAALLLPDIWFARNKRAAADRKNKKNDCRDGRVVKNRWREGWKQRRS